MLIECITMVFICRPHEIRRGICHSKTNLTPVSAPASVPTSAPAQGKGLGLGINAVESTIGQQIPQAVNPNLGRKIANLKIRGVGKPQNIQF
jgi:hypothetical protein